MIVRGVREGGMICEGGGYDCEGWEGGGMIVRSGRECG